MEEAVNGTNPTELTVAICSPLGPRTVQTFVKAHVERLPCEVRFLHGSFPTPDTTNGPVGGRLLSLILREGRRAPTFLRSSLEYGASKVLSHYFKQHGINVVLAEFGPTGTAVADACGEFSAGLRKSEAIAPLPPNNASLGWLRRWHRRDRQRPLP